MPKQWVRDQFKERETDILNTVVYITVDQLAMANSVRWYGHVLRREDGHVLRRALDFEVDSQRKKGRSKRTWKRQVEEENMKVGMSREDALC